MKTPSEHWDEKLREKMDNYESEVPEGLFNAVIKKREQRKWTAALRRRSRHLWLLLLLLIPFTCNYLKNKTVPVAENSTVQKETTAENNQSVVTPAPVTKSANSISSDRQPPLYTNKKNALNKRNETHKKQPLKNGTATVEKPLNNFSEKHNTSGGFYNTSEISGKEKSVASQPDNVLATTEDLPSSAANVTDKNSTVSMSHEETDFISSLPLNTDNLFFENHSLLSVNSPTKINAEKAASEVNNSTAVIEISPSSRDLNWSAEIFFSPDLSFQQLTDVSNDLLTLTDWNKRTEKSFTTGLRLSLNLCGGLLLKSGITYSKEQSSFTLQKTWIVPAILDSTYYYTIWHPFEDPTLVFYSDTIIKSKDSVVNYASSIMYSYWNIPLLAGYTFDFNKFHVGVQSGVVFNAQFSKSGSSINPQTLEPVSLPESHSSFFRGQASLSFYAGIENEYRFNEHLGIFAEPYFQMLMKPITTDAAPVEQRLHKFGLNTGIKFSF